MITNFLSRAMITNTSELTPSLMLDCRSGACRIVYSGTWLTSSSLVARTNMLCMKAACHAFSVTRRTGILYSGSAPQNASLTNRFSAAFRWARVLASSLSKTAGAVGLLTSPHRTSSAIPFSSTMNRSLGERPVLSPVVAKRTPSAVSLASFNSTAVSCRVSHPRFQWTEPFGSKP